MNTKLNEIYKVKSRFYKSVQIELDSFFADYIPTEACVSSSKRILSALDQELGSRAWSIIGPYGSGKSAFVVFLKSLLGDINDSNTLQAREIFKKASKSTYNSLEGAFMNEKGFCLSLVSASRESLEYSILKALKTGMENFDSKAFSRLIKEVDSHLEQAREDDHLIESDKVLKICSKVIDKIEKLDGAGLLLVIDELGKSLEAAALSQEKDIFILQKLAEMASRTKKVPFVLITVLHQSFDRYVNKLNQESRNEWSKIQGRFEDISYLDSNEQIFKLIASSIQSSPKTKFKTSIDALTKFSFDKYLEICANDSVLSSVAFQKTIKSCFPLHPLTVSSLVPLFRNKFAQNERSLFAFLTSAEPYAFCPFLDSQSITDSEYAFFTLANLFDYLNANLVGVLMSGSLSKKWMEIEEALIKSKDEFDSKLIKTIGMFTILKDNLPFAIDDETLKCALNINNIELEKQFNESLERLLNKSVIVYRRHSSSYSIWGGSDIDIEEKIEETKKTIFSGLDIANLLNENIELRPRIAKRHYLKTGTLRSFNVEYINYSKLATKLSQVNEYADGQILLLANSADEVNLQELESLITKQANPCSIVALSSHTKLLTESFLDLVSLDWVKKNTKELQGDKVALKEIEIRKNEIEYKVRTLTDEIFFLLDTKTNADVTWFTSKKVLKNLSKRSLSNLLSDICDDVFSKSPVIKNELINRFKTSSTSTAARTLLLEHMLNNEGDERLAIKGFPAEFSMFTSLCLETKLYQKNENDFYSFERSAEKIEDSWQPLWKYINQYLEDNSYRKVPVLELYSELQKPPFGVREAVLPLILMMFFKAYKEEIAIFAHGTFLAKVKYSDFELLAKVPKHYSIQFCKISGIKSIIFDQIIDTFISSDNKESRTKIKLLDIVRMLCEFASKLPNFVKSTDSLSSKTKAVRKVLLEAREPATLLYKDLPIACGHLPFLDEKNLSDEKTANVFVNDLREAIKELQQKNTFLKARIEKILFNAFAVNSPTKDDREVIAKRAEHISKVTVNSFLKGFLTRVSDASLEYEQWLDSVGTVVTGKPPEDWKDDDLLHFEKEIAALQSEIIKYERISFEAESKSSSATEITQISFTSNKDVETFKLLHIDEKRKQKAKKIANEINIFLEQIANDCDKTTILASLKESSIKYIQEMNSELACNLE